MKKDDLLRKYKGILLPKIHMHCVRQGAPVSLEEVDILLKDHADLIGESCSKMNETELEDLVEWSEQYAAQLGVETSNPNDKLNNKINLNL